MIEYTELARRRSSDAATSSGPEKRFDDPAAAAAAAGCRRSSAFKPTLPFVARMESARDHSRCRCWWKATIRPWDTMMSLDHKNGSTNASMIKSRTVQNSTPKSGKLCSASTDIDLLETFWLVCLGTVVSIDIHMTYRVKLWPGSWFSYNIGPVTSPLGIRD